MPDPDHAHRPACRASDAPDAGPVSLRKGKDEDRTRHGGGNLDASGSV